MEDTHDFEAWVRFYSPDEGGRRIPPTVGYRPAFSYMNQEDENAWLVHVEFFTDRGELTSGTIPERCYARFWILNPELAKSFHKPRLKIGAEIYLVEPPRVGEGVVTKLVGILDR